VEQRGDLVDVGDGANDPHGPVAAPADGDIEGEHAREKRSPPDAGRRALGPSPVSCTPDESHHGESISDFASTIFAPFAAKAGIGTPERMSQELKPKDPQGPW
jgi:hypothetical protein